MTEKPTVAARGPVEVNLTAGEEIWFCTCGKSGTQPFCDGAHKGSSFRPLGHTPETTGPAWLCQCKQTSTPPFCDGSHKALADQQAL
jgi:CDGSH-type Zn-finger protein